MCLALLRSMRGAARQPFGRSNYFVGYAPDLAAQAL
jgi:hypothetical protein